MLRVVQFFVGGYDENLSYVIHDDESKIAAVVDPAGDVRKLRQFIQDAGFKLQKVFLTHTHHDHYDALKELEADYKLEICVHKAGKEAFINKKPTLLTEDEKLELGSSEITVMHTPGHANDSVCFYIPDSQAVLGRPMLISGDTLFIGGCGRTNTEMVEDLYDSLQRIKRLPVNTTVYPGHNYGDTSSAALSYELDHNPYLLAPDAESFRKLRLAEG